jgi:hypothetical protein
LTGTTANSTEFVPDASTRAVLGQVAAFDQGPQVLFERVAARTGQRDDLTNRHTAVLSLYF